MFSDSPHTAPPRRIGSSRAPSGRRARVVERVVLHGAPIDIRELARRAIPRSTRYLVLDLDRTFHLGRNMGELLGWEVSALKGYGDELLTSLEEKRGPGRFIFDWSSPAAVVRYMAAGLRMWAVPGLYYLVFGKLPSVSALGRKLAYARLGPEPVRAAQLVPQTALLHYIAEYPLEFLRTLARRVWDRHRDELVIERDDIAWLREWCPGVTIIVSSASPKPVLEAARDALGVDDVIYTRVEEREGFLSAPFWVDPVLFAGLRPRRISPPSEVSINAAEQKIIALAERYPELLDARTETVGISDTGYGEDHCWAQYFRRVIDVNSKTPFPPIVAESSPLEEVHSAKLLTRRERDARARGDEAYVDPRRKGGPRGVERVFGARELSVLLGDALDSVEAMAERREACADALGAGADAASALADGVLARIEQLVARYNELADELRAPVFSELRLAVRQLFDVRSERARVERPLSELSHALTSLLEGARALLERAPPDLPNALPEAHSAAQLS